jgi:hypothetical protein
LTKQSIQYLGHGAEIMVTPQIERREMRDRTDVIHIVDGQNEAEISRQYFPTYSIKGGLE